MASRFGGEIINGDAMQLYDGLPIITNKIPEHERNGIPHHLIGCIPLNSQPWTVGKFVTSALDIMKDIRSRGRLPVLVGGTHYYTQALLFHDALSKDPEADDAHLDEAALLDRWPILAAPAAEMHAELARVDPTMAERWHPNDHRKIRRSLEIYLQTGRKASEIYQEQQEKRRANVSPDSKNDPGHQQLTAGLRADTLVLWLHADHSVLTQRLDARVDVMVKQGLLDELQTLTDYQAQHPSAEQMIDTNSGIWVSIGYKEFAAYQQAMAAGLEQAGLAKLLAEGIEKTKAATRQYAKRQVRWIRIKLSNAISIAGASDRFFLLDGSDLTSWKTNVSDPAKNLVDKFLQGEELPKPAELSSVAAELLQPQREDMSSDLKGWKRQYCEVCDMTAVTASDWTQHMKSKRHKVLSARRKRQEASEHFNGLNTEKARSTEEARHANS